MAIGDSVLIGPAITGLNINWYDATSTLITNAPGVYVKPAQTTTYTAVEDFCGTTYTNTIVVTVTPTAVKEYEKTQLNIKVYPNPANTLLNAHLQINENQAASISIYNIIGELVKQQSLQNGNCKIQLDDLKSGTYLYYIMIDGKQVKKDKLIIIK